MAETPTENPSLESIIGKSLYAPNPEKTFVDKALAKDEAYAIKEIMQKETLTRKDLQAFAHLLVGTEQKLLNFAEWDRYISAKFFAWIGDFLSVAGQLYDYMDDIEGKKIKIDQETKDMLKSVKRIFIHDIKFLAAVYLFLSRSTLSISGVGFDTLTTQRFEYDYRQPTGPSVSEPEKRGLLGRG